MHMKFYCMAFVCVVKWIVDICLLLIMRESQRNWTFSLFFFLLLLLVMGKVLCFLSHVHKGDFII